LASESAALVVLLIPLAVGIFLVLRPKPIKRYYETHSPIFGGAYPPYSELAIRLFGVVVIVASVASVALAIRFS